MPFLTGYGQQMPMQQPQQLPQIQPSQSGLMANPSAFQFLDFMLNQPGGFNPNTLPGYGTQQPFGMPMYLPQTLSPRTMQPTATGSVAPPVSTAPIYQPPSSGGTHQGSER